MQSALALVPLHILRGADVYATVADVDASASRAFIDTVPRVALGFLFHIKIFKCSNSEGRLELGVKFIYCRHKRFGAFD
jgi:hypothetical protein